MRVSDSVRDFVLDAGKQRVTRAVSGAVEPVPASGIRTMDEVAAGLWGHRAARTTGTRGVFEVKS